jgi:hypothetical protein
MEMRRSWQRAIVLWTLALLVVGCATVGHKFAYDKVDNLVPGVSTTADATQLLGPPASESTYDNGSKLLQWMYSQGTMVGGSGAHVAILFDADGKMVRITHRYKS